MCRDGSHWHRLPPYIDSTSSQSNGYLSALRIFFSFLPGPGFRLFRFWHRSYSGILTPDVPCVRVAKLWGRFAIFRNSASTMDLLWILDLPVSKRPCLTTMHPIASCVSEGLSTRSTICKKLLRNFATTFRRSRAPPLRGKPIQVSAPFL